MAKRSLYGNGGGRNKLAEEEEIDITPMIDCVFLLLIFFMVTSTMQGGKALALPAAKHGLGVNNKEAVVVSVFADETGPGVYLSDSKRENGPADMAAVTAYVKESGKLTMIIKADRDIPSGFIQEVARAGQDANDELLFYVGITDKRSGG